MLNKVKRALLLSDVTSFSDSYEALAKRVGVELRCEADWNPRYRITEEVVILGSKYLDRLNETYFPVAVVILKPGESPAPLIKKGITRFIFDFKNSYELLCALFKSEATMLHIASGTLDDILKSAKIMNFVTADCAFYFDLNRFYYKGKPIYLNNSAKRYLAEWLLNGHKDNAKRMILCNLRKKFGADFLADVNRFGEIKEEKDE